MVCLQIHPRVSDIRNEKFESCTMQSEAECIKNNFKFIISTASGCICKQTTNPFNVKTEFAACKARYMT